MNNSSQEQRMNEEGSLVRWVKAHDLLAFFVLTFLITFGGWIPVFLALPGSDIANIIGLWGPGISAILMTLVTRGKLGIIELFRRTLLWRVSIRWYFVIFCGWPAISILAALLHAQITDQPLSIHWSNWSGFLAMLFSAPVLGLWACEEIGWRGFALPRLLGHWNALFSSIVLGIVWWSWHLPYFLGRNGISPDFYPFLVFTVSLSILMTWVFNHTRGSLFIAITFHFWINIFDAFQADKLALINPGGEAIIEYLLLASAAILVVVLYGYRSLTHDRKSFLLVGQNPEPTSIEFPDADPTRIQYENKDELDDAQAAEVVATWKLLHPPS